MTKVWHVNMMGVLVWVSVLDVCVHEGGQTSSRYLIKGERSWTSKHQAVLDRVDDVELEWRLEGRGLGSCQTYVHFEIPETFFTNSGHLDVQV